LEVGFTVLLKAIGEQIGGALCAAGGLMLNYMADDGANLHQIVFSCSL
jgi:hypothetical protein